MDAMEMNISAYGHCVNIWNPITQASGWSFTARNSAGPIRRWEAAEDAKVRFGHEPYLIAQVGSKWIDESVREVRAKAAKWLAEAGGSQLQMEDIPRRRSQLVE